METSQEKRRKDIERLIAEDNLKEAIEQLSKHTTERISEANCMLILSMHYKDILDSQNKGTVAPEEITRHKSRLRESLQDLLEWLFPKTIPELQTADFESAIFSIRELLSDYHSIRKAFHYLEKLIPQFVDQKDYLDELISIRSAYIDFMIRKIKVLIKPEDISIQFKLILDDTLQLIRDLEAANTNRYKTNFPKKQYLPTFGELASISCDRIEITGIFKDRLDEKEESEQAVMFFLLGEEEYAVCESLVHRLVTILKNSRQGVKYSGFEKTPIPLINFRPNFDVNACLKTIRRGFNDFLREEKGMEKIDSLRALMSNDHQNTSYLEPYQYIPWAMKIRIPEKCWRANGQSFIRSFLEQDCLLNGSFQTKHVFFLIIRLEHDQPAPPAKSGKNLWQRLITRRSNSQSPPRTNLYEDLESIGRGFQDWVTAMPRLRRVVKRDLMLWFREWFKEYNESIQEEMAIEMIINKLDEEQDKTSSAPRAEWDMSVIEKQLRKIVDQHQNALHGI